MKNKLGDFITGPKFGDLVRKAVQAAVAEANKAGLPKAYSNMSKHVNDVDTQAKTGKEN